MPYSIVSMQLTVKYSLVRFLPLHNPPPPYTAKLIRASFPWALKR